MHQILTHLLVLSACQLGLSPAHAQAQPASDWLLRGGVAAMAQPKYSGSDEIRLQALPLLEARWRKNFFAGSLRGVGYETELAEGVAVSLALTADPHQRRRKDGVRVQALDELKLAPALRLGGELGMGPLFVNAMAHARLGRRGEPGARGSSVDLEAGYGLLPQPSLALGLGLTVKVMDAKLGQAMYGVSAAQAARSGLAAHSVGAGITSLGAFAQASYRIDADWLLFAKAGLSSLRGDAGASPLVLKKRQPSLALALSRSF